MDAENKVNLFSNFLGYMRKRKIFFYKIRRLFYSNLVMRLGISKKKDRILDDFDQKRNHCFG